MPRALLRKGIPCAPGSRDCLCFVGRRAVARFAEAISRSNTFTDTLLGCLANPKPRCHRNRFYGEIVFSWGWRDRNSGPMSSEQIYPTAQIARHPIHPMLVPFPIVCFVGTLITDLAYWFTEEVMWADFSAWLVTVGVITGFLAAIA